MDKDAVRVVVGMELVLCEVKRGQTKQGENGEIDKKIQALMRSNRRLGGIRGRKVEIMVRENGYWSLK